MIDLTQEFAESRGRQLVGLIEQDILDSLDRYALIKESRALYDGTATAGMPLPWPNASNINIPLIMEKTEGLVPMLCMAFWGIRPVVRVRRSPEEYNEQQTDAVEQYLNFVVEKDVPDSYETFECWMRDTVICGASPIKVYWAKDFRSVMERHTLKSAYEIGEIDALGNPVEEARFKSGLELLVEIFGPESAVSGLVDGQMEGEGDDTREVVGTRWDVVFTQDRRVYTGVVTFGSSDKVDEVIARVKRSIVAQDCACFDVLEIEDLILPYRAKNVQTASRVTQRYWVTIDDVEEKRRKGEWNLSDEDMEILRSSATVGPEDDHLSTGLDRQKDISLGEDKGPGAEDTLDLPEEFSEYNKNKISVFMTFLSDFVEEGDDTDRFEVIYHIPYALRKIVRADYLDEEFPHGKRPFIIAKYLPKSNRSSAFGIGDQLAAINMECNTIINQINNHQELISNPFFFYEPHAFTGDASSVQRIAPGEGVPVNNVQGVLFPRFSQQPIVNMELMTSLLMFGDRVTVAPLQMGSTQMKNAPRTARGTLAVLGEGHVKTDMFIQRLQAGPWMELFEQLHGLHMELGSDEKWFYVTRKDGELKPNKISRAELRGRYEYYFRGNTTNTNREVLKNMAQVRYATLLSNPLYATSPQQMQNLVRDFLEWWGEGTDIDRLLPVLPGTEGFEHVPLKQEEENQSMRQGIPVSVLPTDDHAAHLAVMDRFEKTDGFALMPAHAVGIYATHRMAHQHMLRQQMAAGQMPTQPGMGNNVSQQLGLGAEGNDQGVLEGGNMR